MACTACRSQTLLAIRRAVAELPLIPRQSTKFLALKNPHQQHQKRQITTSVTTRHRFSQTRQSELVSPALAIDSDDQYVPFDAAPSNENLVDPTPPLMSDSFATPPPPPFVLDSQWHDLPRALSKNTSGESIPDEPSIEVSSEILDSTELQDLSTENLVPTPCNADIDGAKYLGRGKLKISSSAKSTQSEIPKGVKAKAHKQSTSTTSAGKRSRQDRAHVNHLPASHKAQPARQEHWQTYKDGIRTKLGDQQWNPKKRVSPDAMEGIRAMHLQYPDRFTTPVLAKEFGLSADAIRRILKSKWRPNADEEDERRQRWDRRGERIWSDLVEQGVNPPKRWRSMGIGSGPRRPAQNKALQRAIRDGTEPDAATRVADKDAWVQSLAQRLG